VDRSRLPDEFTSMQFHISFRRQLTLLGYLIVIAVSNIYVKNSRYAVILNGYDTIKEALLKKSTHFAGRSPLLSFTVSNPERKGQFVPDV